MKCSQLANFHVERAGPDDTVADAAQKMRDRDIGFLPVCDSLERPVGTLTDRDIALRIVADGRPATTSVASVMTTAPVTCGISDDVEVAEQLMMTHKLSRMLCCDDAGALVAVMSLTDIAQRESNRTTGKVVAEVTSREVHD